MSFEPVRAEGLPPMPKISQMAILVKDQNYSQLDMYARIILRDLPNDPHANLAASWVAKQFNQKKIFNEHFSKSKLGDRQLTDLAADLHLNLVDLESYAIQDSPEPFQTSTKKKFHLIKAWGYGFGAEMAALMGQAYLAELLGREPVVHWGENFLYRDQGKDCVFNHFFESFNDFSIDIFNEFENDSFYPPKWNKTNIYSEDFQKTSGDFSKLSALYFLERTGYRYLVKKYLSPRREIQNIADEFVRSEINAPFLAVHARGSDKDEGYRAMSSIPLKKLNYVKKRLASMSDQTKLFLMTDDDALLKQYSDAFGSRLLTTDSQRSSTAMGVHYNPDSDKRSAGQEMLVDMLIAAQADCFVGLGLSNPSQLITYFGNFTPENYILFGENRLKQFNTHLYKTVSVR